MRVWPEEALDLLAREPRVALVTVVAVAGSAPREAGAKMLVTANDASGTIGGGALEHTCIEQARAMLRREEERARAQDYPLGPLLGQCCGGRVRVALEVLSGADNDWLSAAALFEEHGEEYRLTLPLNGDARRAEAGWAAATEAGVTLLDSAGEVVDGKKAWSSRVEFVRPHPRRILLIGGGHVGAALAALLRQLPVHVSWIDPRPDEDGAALNGAALVADPVRAVAEAPAHTAFLIMTHSHAMDFDLVAAVLRRDDALYCGVIGSKTKRQRFLNRLAQAGLSEEQRARLVCPIGNIGLAGKEPGVIALAVAAEMMLLFEAHERVR